MFMIADNHIFMGRDRGGAGSATGKPPLVLRASSSNISSAQLFQTLR